MLPNWTQVNVPFWEEAKVSGFCFSKCNEVDVDKVRFYNGLLKFIYKIQIIAIGSQ